MGVHECASQGSRRVPRLLEVRRIVWEGDMKDVSEYPRKVYGAWGGNPEGVPYNKERCAYSVIEPRGVAHQCQRKASVGIWCKQHHPDSIQARKEKTVAKYEREMDAIMRPSNMLKAYRNALRRIVNGAHDPRLVAERVLKKWED